MRGGEQEATNVRWVDSQMIVPVGKRGAPAGSGWEDRGGQTCRGYCTLGTLSGPTARLINKQGTWEGWKCCNFRLFSPLAPPPLPQASTAGSLEVWDIRQAGGCAPALKSPSSWGLAGPEVRSRSRYHFPHARVRAIAPPPGLPHMHMLIRRSRSSPPSPPAGALAPPRRPASRGPAAGPLARRAPLAPQRVRGGVQRRDRRGVGPEDAIRPARLYFSRQGRRRCVGGRDAGSRCVGGMDTARCTPALARIITYAFLPRL